jgi:hypoxanthine phosphoribosyltransferase
MSCNENKGLTDALDKIKEFGNDIATGLEDLDNKLQEAASKAEAALDDMLGGLQGAIDEVTESLQDGINDIVSEINKSTGGFLSNLDSDLKGFANGLNTFDNELQDKIAQLQTKFGDALEETGKSVEDFINGVLAGDDICKTVPKLEAKSDGTVVEQPTQEVVPTAKPIEPFAKPKVVVEDQIDDTPKSVTALMSALGEGDKQILKTKNFTESWLLQTNFYYFYKNTTNNGAGFDGYELYTKKQYDELNGSSYTQYTDAVKTSYENKAEQLKLSVNFNQALKNYSAWYTNKWS